MKLLIAFLKDKTREISLYAGTVGIFIVVAFLYNIRMDALKYALLLVILWLLLYVITEYHRFRKKHLLLERFKKSTDRHQDETDFRTYGNGRNQESRFFILQADQLPDF